MERLRQRDLEALLSYLRGIYSELDLDDFAPHLVATLPGIVPSEFTAYHVFDSQMQTVTAFTEPVIPDLAGAAEAFRQHAPEHPRLDHYRQTRDGRAYKLSDFLTQRQYHRLGLYNELYKELETEYQMTVTLPEGGPFLIAIAFNRSSTDFSERDRLLLNLLHPHLVQAYRNAEAVTRLKQNEAYLRQALEESDRGVIVLSGDEERVLLCTQRARQWLLEYFEPARGAERLPESLQRWVKHQRSLLSKDSVPPPREPLISERPDRRLVVRLIAGNSEDPQLLVLEEQCTSASVASLESLGLTRREAEIMFWIARGKTDKEVAVELYISPRTVHKHLEHIYRKLGVESRTEAAAQALEVSGLP